MPKSPEQFDFSKQEDQEKFEELPKEKREAFIEQQTVEAYKMKEKVESGEASDYDESLKLIEKEVRNEKWREIYEKTETKKVEEVPQEIEKLLGGDLFKEGKTTINSMDEKEGVFAAILEKHKSEEGHGIRYSVKTILEQKGKIHDSGLNTVRGAYRDERDDFSRWWKEIKVIEVKGENITVGKASGDLINIETINLKTGKKENVAQIDLAKERERAEEEKLKKQLEKSKNFEEVAVNTKILLEKSHSRVEIKTLKEDLKLLIGKDYANAYDPVISDITFYLLKKEKETLEKFYKDPGVSTSNRPRFSSTFPYFDFGELQETKDEIVIPVKMTIIQPVGAPERYRNKLKEEEFEIKFKK